MIQVKLAIGSPGRYAEDWHYRPNSAGGVSVRGYIKNIGTKSIKYCYLTVTPYNAVGDVVKCSITGYSSRRLKETGPLSPNSTDWGTWKNMWYNPSIVKVQIEEAEIEYMDGTSEIIPGNQITDIKSSGGCYVATAVYGSYDCPQVWTLRRFRDYTLANTWYGRAFIHTYYAISPTLVKWFGHTDWFKRMWKGKLDRMVSNLNNKGVADTPYEDRKW